VVYCNWPEGINSPAYLGDSTDDPNGKGHFLNKVTVNSGSAQLYASYLNQLSQNLNFGIQLYNPGSSSVTVTLQNNGFRASTDEQSVVCGVWADFFATPGGTVYTIPSGGVAWIQQGKSVPAGYLFNSVVRFQVSGGSVYCIPYLYSSLSNINGQAVFIDWVTSARQYRGYGPTYFINATATIDIGSGTGQTSFETHLCNTNNPADVVAITEPQTGAVYSCSNNPPANLGNYEIQYSFTMNVHNSSGSTKNLYAYLGSSDGGGYAFINMGGTVNYGHFTATGQAWNWLTDTVSANSTNTYTYQVIHPAQSSGKVTHLWTPTALA
jgi:hypothetical protein